MTVDISWFLEGRIICMRLTENLTPEDVETLNRGLLSGVSEAHKLTPFLKHPKLGWFIVFGNKIPKLRLLRNIIMQMSQVRHRNFETREETLEFLQKMDASLPDLQELNKRVEF